MRTITLDKMLDKLVEAGLPAAAIHPCDEAVSLMTSRWARETFASFVLADLWSRKLTMRRNIFDCEDVAMAVRTYAVEMHRKDPRDSVVEDPTGMLATGIAVGFVFIPGHSVNVVITSDSPEEYTVRFFDFTLEGKEVQLTKEQLNQCKLVII